MLSRVRFILLGNALLATAIGGTGQEGIGQSWMPPYSHARSPAFLNKTDEAAQLEFAQIVSGKNLAKGDMKERVHAWADKQPESMVFERLTTILDDPSIMRRQMEDELRRTADGLDADAVTVARALMRRADARVGKKYFPQSMDMDHTEIDSTVEGHTI